MEGRFFHFVASILIGAVNAGVDETPVPCPVSDGSDVTTVRYFYGEVNNNYQYIGTPVLGRVECRWNPTMKVDEMVCPFFIRQDTGSPYRPISEMEFSTSIMGLWDCSGPEHRLTLGQPNYCWFTSTIIEGPSIHDTYNMLDGAKNILNYMIYKGVGGTEGVCANASSTCETEAYLCEEGYMVKPGEVYGVGGCQSRFCDPDTSFSRGCCAAVCATKYGPNVGDCDRGKFGGVYDNACQDYTCVASDASRCCRDTAGCIDGYDVLMFGHPIHPYDIVRDFNDVIVGQVDCDWFAKNQPPTSCPYHPRIGGTNTGPVFQTVDDGTRNCALQTAPGQVVVERYCWFPAQIRYGPTVSGNYQVFFTLRSYDGSYSSFEREVPYYKLHRDLGVGIGNTSCNQGSVSCISTQFVCETLVPGSTLGPMYVAGNGLGDWNSGVCQARYCDPESFAAACCFTTTTTSTGTTTNFSTGTTTNTSTVTTTTTGTTTNYTTTSTTNTTTTTNATTPPSTSTTNTTTTTSTTTTTTTTLNLTLFGDDPVTWFGNESKEFWLPIGVLMPVMYTKEFTMLGSTFQGNIYEQWFDRIVINGPDDFPLAAISIKKDLVAFNRSKGKRRKNGFETIDLVLGAEGSPLEVMPDPNSFFRRWDVHIGISKIDDIFHYGPHLRTQTTIGGARREVVQLRCKSAHILIISSPATEYFGDHSYLAAKYAHLDVVILEMTDTESLRGVLPELWGFRPVSNRTKALLTPPWSKNATLNTSNSTHICQPDLGDESDVTIAYGKCKTQSDDSSESDSLDGQQAFL